MKEKYIEYANNNINGEANKIVLKQIDLFYKDRKQSCYNYKIGEELKLKNGYLLHGISGSLEQFDMCVENGFISSNFSGNLKPNKFYNSIGVWNIKKDILLSEYIKNYSGCTIGYTLGRGPGSTEKSELVPYNQIEERMIELNNNLEIWSWRAEQTKEIRFLPSLSSNKNQIAFILDASDNKELLYADLFNKDFNEDILKNFIVEQCIDEMINGDRNAFTTDRESAIMFGLPSTLIIGILLGRNYENNKDVVIHIKQKLPKAFICNLDGIIIS